MKRKHLSTILVVILLIAGLGVLLYPTISDAWNKHRNAMLTTEYDTVISEMNGDELETIRQIAIAYNQTLIGNELPDAFAELQLPPDATYDTVLNPLGNGYMGTVEIPKIKVDLPIYHYTTPEVLEKGAGHLAGSSLPVGGPSTHSVISAHRGLPSAKLFTDLDKLVVGDTFYLHILEETLAYEADLIKVIEPTDTSDLAITEGEDYCTLFTCTPYAVNTHRLLVRGHRIPYSEDDYNDAGNAVALPSGISVLIRILCVLAGFGIAGLIYFIYRKWQKRKRKQ